MARARRQKGSPQVAVPFTFTGGSNDGTTAIDVIVPSDKAYVVAIVLTMKTAGTGTGTFTVSLKDGSTVLLQTLPVITAADVAGTYEGSAEGTGVTLTEGDRLSIATVKTGSVTGDATLVGSIIFGM